MGLEGWSFDGSWLGRDVRGIKPEWPAIKIPRRLGFAYDAACFFIYSGPAQFTDSRAVFYILDGGVFFMFSSFPCAIDLCDCRRNENHQ